MKPEVPPIHVQGPEPWRGVESLPRVRELEHAGLKRKAIARIFGITMETIRTVERKTKSNQSKANSAPGQEEWRAALDRFVACGVRGVNLPDEAMDRESIYFGEP